MVHKGSSGDPTRAERAERARQRGQEKARRERLVSEVTAYKSALHQGSKRYSATGARNATSKNVRTGKQRGIRQLTALRNSYNDGTLPEYIEEWDDPEADFYH
jgi:hypothetical protein